MSSLPLSLVHVTLPDQDAAARFRLGYYLRRYHAQDCDARQLHVAAEWMAALLAAGLPQQPDQAPAPEGAHAAWVDPAPV
jgi:hypothetical protein